MSLRPDGRTGVALLAVAAALLLATASPAQAETFAPDPDDPATYVPRHHQQRGHMNAAGLGVLGAWSVASMTWGGVGLAVDEPDTVAANFHRMTLMWGGINLGIAGAGIVVSLLPPRGDVTAIKSLRQGRFFQVVFGINAGIDVGYVAAGVLMAEIGRLNGDPVLQGYGPAVSIQGAALLGFDVVMLVLNAAHDGKLERMIDGVGDGPVAVTATPAGISVRFASGGPAAWRALRR